MNKQEKRLVEVIHPGHTLTTKEAYALAKVAMRHGKFSSVVLSTIPDETKGLEGRIMQLMAHVQICDGCRY